MILNRNLEADLGLSCSSQMSIIVMFVSSMKSSLFGKRLASVCSVSVDDVPNCVSIIFLAQSQDFMMDVEQFKKQKQKIW